MVVAVDAHERPSMSSATLAARRDRALGAGAPLFYNTPLHIVRGEGVSLFDPDGRRYIDMYNNVPCVGHANPHVTEAMARQQGTLNVHSRYLHEGIVAFAERFAALHRPPSGGPAIESVVFSCSGTEANEVALRMARIATGKAGIVCTNATYHGNSEAIGKLTRIGDISNATGNVRAIPFPEMLRPLVPGAIADEVQAGYCRSGRWWGYEVTGFTPDIVVTGKPMGNGLPLAATAASRALVEGFRAATRYFNTFASSPLQAAVGMAVLDVIERDGLRENVATVGAFLKSALVERKARFASIADVRGHGLFVGVEIAKTDAARTPDTDRAVEIINRLKDKGFLTSNAGAFRNVVKIRPPLVFAQSHAEEFLVAFDATIAELDG